MDYSETRLYFTIKCGWNELVERGIHSCTYKPFNNCYVYTYMSIKVYMKTIIINLNLYNNNLRYKYLTLI